MRQPLARSARRLRARVRRSRACARGRTAPRRNVRARSAPSRPSPRAAARASAPARRRCPRARAPAPPPRIRRPASRMPKNAVHSAPEYVVGIETTGSDVSAETAFAVSIALPPPSATSTSAPAVRRCRGHLADPVGRQLAPPADGARHPRLQRAARSRAVRVARPRARRAGRRARRVPQRTITRCVRARTRRTRRRRGSPSGRSRARARSPASRSSPSTRAAVERPRRQLRLDRRPRDERDAVARLTALRTDSCRPSSSRTSRSRSRSPSARSSSSTIWRTPAPSCITIRLSSRSSSSETVRPANACPGGHARITSSSKNGSKRTERCRRAAPTMPSSSSRAATRSTTDCVSETASETRTPGCARWNSQSSSGTTIARGAGRGADLQLARELALALAGDLVEQLLLEREDPLRAAVEAQAGLGRLHAAPRAVEQPACRAASRAPGPGARRPAA